MKYREDPEFLRLLGRYAEANYQMGSKENKGRPSPDDIKRVEQTRDGLLTYGDTLDDERAKGVVELGSIALMIGGHFREGVWFLEHPKAPAPIPCESIAHMVEKYLKIIERFGVVAP